MVRRSNSFRRLPMIEDSEQMQKVRCNSTEATSSATSDLRLLFDRGSMRPSSSPQYMQQGQQAR